MACQDCLFEFLCIRKNLPVAGSVGISGKVGERNEKNCEIS